MSAGSYVFIFCCIKKVQFLDLPIVGSSVKFSQLKYTLSENQGVINISVLHIGVPQTSVRVKLLLDNETNSGLSVGKSNYNLLKYMYTCWNFKKNYVG